MFKHELQEDETLPNFLKRKHPKEGRRRKFFCKAPGDSNKQRTSLSLSLSQLVGSLTQRESAAK